MDRPLCPLSLDLETRSSIRLRSVDIMRYHVLMDTAIMVHNGTHRKGWLFTPLGYGYRGRHVHSRWRSAAYARELFRADARAWTTAHHGPTSAQLVMPLVGILLAGALLVGATFAPQPYPQTACWDRPDKIHFGYCWWDGKP